MCFFIPEYVTNNVIVNSRFLSKTNWFRSPTVIYNSAHNNVLKLNDASSISVYDAENDFLLPGKLVRDNPLVPVDDVVVNEAFDFSKYTWELFYNKFGRDSIDDNGFKLTSTVHYGYKYPNAFWNGSLMVYGDGDGEVFKRFTVLDVVAHELTHGVTEFTAGLKYLGQSGALNEHFSDVFGSIVKQHVHGQNVNDANWIIGEGIFTDLINGVGIRSMKAPGTAYDDPIIGKDRQTSHMNDYNHSPEDNYGVHINSGIPNKAFYEFAKNIGGYSWDIPGQVWYKVLTNSLNERSDFQNMADATQDVVINMYGTGMEYRALREAWRSVGLVPTHHIFKGMR